MNKIYDDIMELVESELEAIAKKQEMSEQDLACLDKLVDVSKDIKTIEAMELGGYSGNSSYGMPYNYMGYDVSYGRAGSTGNYARGGRSSNNRMYANNGSSYGRNFGENEMRMMPDRREWM